jgi:ubiquinol-cytochrome c reductase cytochrome b subunit
VKLPAFGDWLDERTGFRAAMRAALDEPVPGGARFRYVWGSCLAFVLITQAVTGIVMATCYSPSTTDAWASVAYLQDQLPAGWFVRGLHSAGASAMILLLLAHMLQVTLAGAYKRPREVNWLVGVGLMGLVLAFALTGYLLPWDQKGYWATQVATSLAGAVPGIGRGLQRLILGGDQYGNLTLTRFYALHVLVLPAITFALVGLHVLLFRKHGVTPPAALSEEELKRRVAPFWPDQLLKDFAAMAVVLGIMVWSVVRSHGAELEAPADPTSSYDARPEWYFLPLFQLLKLFPGRAEVAAALGAPLLVVGTLVLLPFLDRGASRSFRVRKRFVGAVAAILGGAVVLGVAAKRQDARSESFQAQRERATKEAERARALAREGVPPAGGTAVWENDPDLRARKLMVERCLGCHPFGGAGEARAPVLDGWGSKAYLADFLRDPDSARFFGKTEIHGMKPVSASDEERRALVEYVWAQGGDGPIDEALKQRGAELFQAKDCDECHEVDGASPGQGPNFGGRGGADWVRAFLIDPGEGRFYGKRNRMPKFGEKLTGVEIEALVRLLRNERRGVGER